MRRSEYPRTRRHHSKYTGFPHTHSGSPGIFRLTLENPGKQKGFYSQSWNFLDRIDICENFWSFHFSVETPIQNVKVQSSNTNMSDVVSFIRGDHTLKALLRLRSLAFHATNVQLFHTSRGASCTQGLVSAESPGPTLPDTESCHLSFAEAVSFLGGGGVMYQRCC